MSGFVVDPRELDRLIIEENTISQESDIYRCLLEHASTNPKCRYVPIRLPQPRLEPVKRVARMIRQHWEGVMNAATRNVTNALAEAINSKIQWIKRMASGYRNRENFRNAIYFHLGALDLYPETLRSAHPKP